MAHILPVIPLRGMVVLPGEIVHCDAGRKITLAAVQAAVSNDGGTAFFSAQKDERIDDPSQSDIHTTGTICQVKQIFRVQGDSIHILVTGIERAYIKEFTQMEPYIEAGVCSLDQTNGDESIVEALVRRVREAFGECAGLTGRISASQRKSVNSISDPGDYAYAVAALFVTSVDERQSLLEESNVETRLMVLLSILRREIQILRVDALIQKKLQLEIEKNQKEYYLRERIKVIRRELGDGEESDADSFRQRMEKKELPEAVEKRLLKEINRYETLPSGSHESPMARAFIECILDLPWTEETADDLDLKRARRVLDKNHYGMEKVKERILEYLAVQKLTGRANGQILCLVGPPGVGKTSIVASIAEAMGRKFVRMSLGGVRDEADIRGHRRTYIGAMPGRVISAMRTAGSINPILLFDEIDKLSTDYRGDPASAMLEVLDSAQNFAFTDHFLELPYDLSHAMLMTTANDKSTIPKPLYDRMEIIDVQSYLSEEKLQIAKRHLLKKQLKAHGLKKANIRLTDKRIAAIIHNYTRESGVRELERMLAAVCRKAAIEVSEGVDQVSITAKMLEEYLGKPRYRDDLLRRNPETGVATGLAWTPTGGETLSIEAVTVPGTGKLELTGHLGEVMQESAKAALTYVRAHADEWHIDRLKDTDIHLHVPQGAVPKDGPSAGAAMSSAILSALSGIPVRADVAMTGEITLSGRVLAIGGVREKALAALRAGITRVLIPVQNRKDTEEIPEPARSAIDFTYVETLDDVFANVLTQKKPRRAFGANDKAIEGIMKKEIKEDGFDYLPVPPHAPAGYRA